MEVVKFSKQLEKQTGALGRGGSMDKVVRPFIFFTKDWLMLYIKAWTWSSGIKNKNEMQPYSISHRKEFI